MGMCLCLHADYMRWDQTCCIGGSADNAAQLANQLVITDSNATEDGDSNAINMQQ